MAPIVVIKCSVADGEAIDASCIPGFWADPNYLTLPAKPAEQTGNIATPKSNRSRDGSHTWLRQVVPLSSYEINSDGTPVWPEAQVQVVEPEKEAEIRRIAETVVWDPDNDADQELSDRVTR
ncbi:Acyl-CoA N-acyltransferase [Penicillium sp. IBT 35674x]|nr:Acyl-CoA N-acyltransferase [Penicillium sp. IBT 35674x]